jgi:hypothetical protein
MPLHRREYSLRFPGSEDDIEFWQVLVVALLRRYAASVVCLPLEELATTFDLDMGIDRSVSSGALMLQIDARTKVLGPATPVEMLAAEGARPS